MAAVLRHRAGDPAPGDRSAVRQARRPARAPPAGQAVASRTSRPPGRQHEHERHLQAVNEAADQLESLAEASRGGRVSRNAVKVARGGRAQAPAPRRARAPTRTSSARAGRGGRPRAATTRSATACPTTRSCTATRAASPIPSGAWAASTASTSPASGDDVQQWARVQLPVGVRTVPAGSLQFVDFSKPDPGADRVERFMTAAQHALAEGDFALAAQRLVYARDAEPRNAAVLRLMTLAFWQAGNLPAAARAVRDWARVERDRPTPAPLRRAHLRGHGRALAGRRGRRARGRARRRATPRPGSGSAGCGCAARPRGRVPRRSSARA